MSIELLAAARKYADSLVKPELAIDLSKWKFTRSTTSTHPQTEDALDVNEPALVYAIPKQLDRPICKLTGERSQAVTAVRDGVWYGRRPGNKHLVKSEDQGATWDIIHTFADIIVEGPLVTSAGTFLINLTGGIIQRSTDGVTWNTVLTLGTNARARWTAFTSEGSNVYIGEYGSELGSQKVYKSSDDGLTWATIADETGLVRHIHFIREDPYNGDLWYGTGDSDVQCFVKKSSDGGTTWDTIGTGSQAWRITDIRFDENYAYFGGDGLINPDAGQYFGVFRYNKTAETWETLRDNFDHPFYTVEWDAFGKLWFIGSAQHHATVSQEPNYSVIQILDPTTKNFIESVKFPVLPGSKGGIVRVVFDGLKGILWGSVGLPWNGSRVIDLLDYYYQGIRVNAYSTAVYDPDNEMLQTRQQPANSGVSMVVMCQIPEDSDTRLAANKYNFIGEAAYDRDNGFGVAIRPNNSIRCTKRKTGETSASIDTGVATWKAGEILVIGACLDSNGRMFLQSLSETYGWKTATPSSAGYLPTNLDKIYAGCRFAGDNQLNGYILAAKFWPYGLSDGELESAIHEMYGLVYPN